MLSSQEGWLSAAEYPLRAEDKYQYQCDGKKDLANSIGLKAFLKGPQDFDHEGEEARSEKGSCNTSGAPDHHHHDQVEGHDH